MNSFFSLEFPIFQAPSSQSGSPQPRCFPFSCSQMQINIAEQKNFNLAKSLASASQYCFSSFSSALAKMRIRCTQSTMYKVIKNKAEWNHSIWAHNILWTSTKRFMLTDRESALDDLNSTDQTGQQLPCLSGSWAISGGSQKRSLVAKYCLTAFTSETVTSQP